MTVDRPIVVCVALSVAAHVVFARGMQHLPRRPDLSSPRKIAIRVIAPPPPAEPPPEPAKAAPVPAEPKPVARERPRARPQAANQQPPTESPPPQPSPSPGDNTGMPVFGVSMESTSQAGQGPALPIGGPSGPAVVGGGRKAPAKGAEGPPVAEYEVTTMPLPQGRCVGKYTDEAREAAIEGTVVLELVVGSDGRPRDIHVVSGLGYGLTEAAIAALKSCRFSPGQKNGLAVPVRLREFKIRFLQNDQNE
ncbi:MAG TPA: energy transducer TonB [Polyangia bacterium]